MQMPTFVPTSCVYVHRCAHVCVITLASLCACVWLSVHTGELEALLQAYDRERRALPSPVVMWEWGWTKSAETWNGRLAMVALFVIVLLEVTTGQSIMRNLLDID